MFIYASVLIVRATGVSSLWLQYYVNEKYENVPRVVVVSRKSKGRLTIECDELWSLKGTKGNKQWIWGASDRDTRKIVGVFVGDRSRESAFDYGIHYLAAPVSLIFQKLYFI